jgi:23S rRNA (guanosine2251-2'-O)-methyltransferase
MSDDLWVVGFHAVLGVLESEQPVDQVWLQKDRRDRRSRQVAEAAHRRGLRYDLVPRRRLDGVAGGAPHNGCAVRTSPVGFVSLDEVLRPPGRPASLLLLDHVTDPHNLGAVVRTAAAFAIDGVIIAGPSAPPLGGAAVTAAAGHIGRIPMVRERVAADALSRLRDRGYWVVAAEAGAPSLRKLEPAERWVACVGAEARGLRAKTRSRVDEFVAIPMADGVESLNLSVATGILLWELTRDSTSAHPAG